MKGIWTEKEIEFLRKNYKDMAYSEISNILGRSCGSVTNKAKSFKLQKGICRMWDDREIDYLKTYYNIMPPIKIAEYLNRSYRSIFTKASNLGLKAGYKYFEPKYNENFFDDLSFEAHWLIGIVLADGHISNPSNRYSVRIGMCDEDVIEKIKNMTNYKGNIIKRRSKSDLQRDYYTIVFCGKKFHDFFTNLEMDNNKSFTAKFPANIPHKYIVHVIRGLFDGDGCVSIDKRNYYPSVRIVGTEKVIRYIANNINLFHTIRCCKNGISFYIQYTGERAIKFLEYIYQDSTPNTRMDRKYNKYLDVLKFWKGAGK